VKDIGQQRIDITTIKMVMKPVQRAVKDVSKSISDSPLYHAALRPANNNSANTSFGLASPQSLAPPFQGGYQGNFTAAGLNTALAQAMPLNLGPPTSVPATPLTAALGPAAQATLSQSQGQGEYFSSHSAAGSAVGVRGMHERLDTMIQHPPGPGAAYNQYGQQLSQQSNNNISGSNGNNNYAGFPHTARRVDMNR